MGKIVRDRDELARIVGQLKAEGKVVVLTNGCFDLVHVGHIRCLRGAKAEGDVLIVAINDDNYIRKYKRDAGPVNNQDYRMEILSEFTSVDYVTIFGEKTIDSLLEKLRPDVHAKGTDYTPENLPERDTVHRIGARIAIVGDPKDHSTADTLYRIKAIETG